MASCIPSNNYKSINSPIAAFTMAVLLGSYCIASIRSARNESAPAASDSSAGPANGQPPPRSYRDLAPKVEQPPWMQQALRESWEARNWGSK
jgi:hypothetical protein